MRKRNVRRSIVFHSLRTLDQQTIANDQNTLVLERHDPNRSISSSNVPETSTSSKRSTTNSVGCNVCNTTVPFESGHVCRACRFVLCTKCAFQHLKLSHEVVSTLLEEKAATTVTELETLHEQTVVHHDRQLLEIQKKKTETKEKYPKLVELVTNAGTGQSLHTGTTEGWREKEEALKIRVRGSGVARRNETLLNDSSES